MAAEVKRTELRPSAGTRWPTSVRQHVAEHQGVGLCIGPLAGMPGDCEGQTELDHLRSSGGMGIKSPSVAANGAQLCNGTHHPMKGAEGRTWRPRLIAVIDRLSADCPDCESERRALRYQTAMVAQ